MRIKRAIEERRRAIAEYGCSNRCLLPKRLWHNVPLEVYEAGGVEAVFHGDDYIDEGKVKKVELRLKEPVSLSFIKKWLEEGGLLKALRWILVFNGVAEPPREEDELSRKIVEKLAELKVALNYIEEARRKYLG